MRSCLICTLQPLLYLVAKSKAASSSEKDPLHIWKRRPSTGDRDRSWPRREY